MINIKVSGGSSNFNNVVEGDHNHVIAGSQAVSSGTDATAFATFFKSLQPAAGIAGRDDAEVTALRTDVTQLQHEIKTAPSKEDLIDKAHRLYDKYSWAGGLLKTLFAVVFPGLQL